MNHLSDSLYGLMHVLQYALDLHAALLLPA